MLVHKIKINKFLYLRANIGHTNKSLDKTMNSFIIGNYQNISIINNDYLLWSWERIGQLFNNLFLIKSKFFVLGINKNIPNMWLRNFLDSQLNSNKFKLPSFLGYIGSDWSGGLISNWNKLWLFVVTSFKKLSKNKKLSKKQERLLQKMIDRGNKGITPAFPDFLIALSIDNLLIKEANLSRVLTIGLVDTNKSPDNVNFPILSNDDSLGILEFFFGLLDKSTLESNRIEQNLFYTLVFKKLKILLKNG